MPYLSSGTGAEGSGAQGGLLLCIFPCGLYAALQKQQVSIMSTKSSKYNAHNQGLLNTDTQYKFMSTFLNYQIDYYFFYHLYYP
jgi:hypothetical protein